MIITVRLAELNIGIKYNYGFTREYVKDYVVDAEPDFTVEATAADLLAEAEMAEGEMPDEYLEYVAIYRKIADKLTEFDGAVFHGAVIEYEGKAYLITARSGTGKTTHVRIWKEKFGESVDILNGDKPILRVLNGKICACGNPWQGKEGYGKNAIRELCGIAFLERAPENSYAKIDAKSAAVRFMGQIYMNRNNPAVIMRTLKLSDKILSEVPLFEFRCNMDISAAEMAHEAFIGNKSV